MAWAEARILRESPNVFICVSSFNPDARRLYERQGRMQEYREIVDRLKAERITHLEGFHELTPEIVKAVG